MRRLNRSLMALFVTSLLATGFFGVMMSARLAAESSTPNASSGPHIVSYQKPRLQSFFAGGDASFTVYITNTGSVTLQTVTITNATSPDCNKNGLGPLPPGASITPYTCERDNVTASFLNEMTVNGMATGQPVVSHKSDAYVTVFTPQIRIRKEPTTQLVRYGEVAHFTVTLQNTSAELLNVVWVDDNLVADCDFTPGSIVPLLPTASIIYPCEMENVQEPMTTIIGFRAVNPITQNTYTATTAAWVDVAKLEATLTPSPATMPEPGGLVNFTVDLVNSGSVSLTPTALTTNAFGNLLDPTNPLLQAGENTCLDPKPLPTLPGHGGTYRCSFMAQVNGQPPSATVNLTATGQGPGVLSVTTTTVATMVIQNVPASMDLSLAAEPAFISPPGQLVTFQINVINTSEVDSITVTKLEDEFLGDLNGVGTCVLPSPAIQPGNLYSCQFSVQVQGEMGEQKSRVITAWASSDDPTPELLVVAESVVVSLTNQPVQKQLFPVVADDVVEPNNSCSRPYPLILGRQYFFLPPAKFPADQDYFSFDVQQSGAVTVDLTSFVPGSTVSPKGQLSIFPHDDDPEGSTPCGFPSIYHTVITAANHQFTDIGTVQPGRYYIRVINDGPSNVQTRYGLRVRVE